MEVATPLEELAPQPAGRLVAFVALEGSLGFIAGAIMLRGNSAGVAFAIVVILVALAFPVAYVLWLFNARLLIGQGVAGYRDMFGRRRLWSPSDIARVVRLTIVYYSPRSGEQRKQALLLVGADGRCLLKVRTANWTDDAIEAFTAATRHPAEYVDSCSSLEAARQFPGSVGFMYAHPGWTAAITAGVVAAIGAGFLWWGLTR